MAGTLKRPIVRSTILFVPGLRDHVAEHWQTLAAAEIAGARTVPPLDRDRLSRAARVAALDQAIAEIDGPIVLAAHSAGCLTVAHWAQTHSRPIHGALLATPANVEAPLPAGYPTMPELEAGGWLPLPRKPLPFRSLMVASSNDPLASEPWVANLADAWGSRLIKAGAVGHLNPAAGYGAWPDALWLLSALDDGLPRAPQTPATAAG